LNRYPDGDCFTLRHALSRDLKVNPQQLIFGNGSDEIIVLVVRAFIHPGDEVIIADPSFLVYNIASLIEGAKVKRVALKDFRYDLTQMKRQITAKTKIVFIGNPDNPAGTYIRQKEMEAFLKGLPSRVLVFVDEAYYEFVKANDYVNSLGLLKRYKNLIVTRTFSKLYGLAGLRIGYGIAHQPLIDILNRVREPFNVNTLAQMAALACLKNKAYYAKLAQKIEDQKKFLYKEFNRRGISFVESWTNFILVQTKNQAPKVAGQLCRQGVIVRDMSYWGLKKYIRVTVGTPQENLRLLNALEEIL
ncbi:MAG: histidinol-phosphate transaminase, partial [Candidatus Omnitrophota bacterium]|nr:histidinol-phosphate transaminase [Candidatus Omnitrophota bacterium]